MKQIIVPVVAILAIVALEIMALIQGINGSVFTWVIVVISGLGGYEVKALRDRKKWRPKK